MKNKVLACLIALTMIGAGVVYAKEIKCPDCKGKKQIVVKNTPCAPCKGKGYYELTEREMMAKGTLSRKGDKCTSCNGKGKYDRKYTCTTCGGDGKIEK
ncbi:MAG: hypothetical protein FWG13_05605 [Leptospirales bacterium]|nr:hypothetical protein [Leptospirales bacterium]